MNGVTKHNHRTEILYYPGGGNGLTSVFQRSCPEEMRDLTPKNAPKTDMRPYFWGNHFIFNTLVWSDPISQDFSPAPCSRGR